MVSDGGEAGEITFGDGAGISFRSLQSGGFRELLGIVRLILGWGFDRRGLFDID